MAMRSLLTCCVLVCLVSLTSAPTVWGQSRAETTNFVVVGPSPQLTQKVANEAERYRRELAFEWLGRELPTWQQKCPIKVQISQHAGGETSFAFTQGGNTEPMDWQMVISGPPDRLLDAVLPHEITHTIFATHFRRPLPRWADEGACTTVEHETERSKNHKLLIRFLTSKPSKGIPFNRMFMMREYPHDILPLYAQGFSLAKFLIAHQGKQHFVNYIGAGMKAERSFHDTASWDQVTNEFYGFENLSDLQLSWLKWVKEGSQPVAVVASAPAQPNGDRWRSPGATLPSEPVRNASITQRQPPVSMDDSWYLRQTRVAKDPGTSAGPERTIYR